MYLLLLKTVLFVCLFCLLVVVVVVLGEGFFLPCAGNHLSFRLLKTDKEKEERQ